MRYGLTIRGRLLIDLSNYYHVGAPNILEDTNPSF